MRPKQLAQFLAICQHGSMSSAAKALNIAQPALSKQIAQLEHELQASLFIRHSRGITLTRAGSRLREEAAELIRRIESLKTSVRQGDVEISGDVTLALITSLAPAIAVELYKRIEQDYPKIRLRIIDYRSDRACTALMNQEADFAIVPNAAVDLPQAESLPLFQEDFYLLSRGEPGPRQGSVSLASLADMPLVSTFHGHDLRRRIEEAARNSGISLNIKYETSSINVIGKMIEEGLAYSILPATFWLSQIASGKIMIRPLINPSISRVHSLCWLPSLALSPAAKVIRDLVPVEIQTMMAAGKLSANPLG
jgi:LysR family nitrogen assimilation transcriptional regulator